MRTGRGWAWVMLGLVLAGCGSAPEVGRAELEGAAVVAAQPGGTSGSLLSAQALGPSGTLDLAYGEQGVASLSTYASRLVKAVVQSDGQVLLMNQSRRGGRVSSHLQRITAGGQPDAAFNSAATSYFPETDSVPALLCPRGGNRYNDWGAECEDPQRIVVASSDLDTGALTLARFLPSGQLDPSFGAQGKVAAAVSVGDVSALLIQSDGSMVVLGSEGLARFRRGGALDRNFGTGGVAPLTVGGWVQDIVMDAAERFLLLVNTDGGTEPGTQVLRLTQTGQPDPSYGKGGRVSLDFGPMGTGEDLLMLSTNRVVVGGSGGLWRLLPGGAPDPSFGEAGHFIFTDTGERGFLVTGLVEDNQRRLVASVKTDASFTPTFQGTLARLRGNGTLDSSFGQGGLAYVNLCAACSGGLAEFNSVAVLKNGHLLGLGTNGRGSNLISARMFP